MSLDLVGPFQGEYVAVLNGWSIPLIDARENDGGTVSIIIDRRLAYTISAGEAENVLKLIADVIAVAWGYGAHPTPEREDGFVDRAAAFLRVPHPSIAPRRMIGIEAVSSELAESPDDPRND